MYVEKDSEDVYCIRICTISLSINLVEKKHKLYILKFKQ